MRAAYKEMNSFDMLYEYFGDESIIQLTFKWHMNQILEELLNENSISNRANLKINHKEKINQLSSLFDELLTYIPPSEELFRLIKLFRREYIRYNMGR